MKFSTFLMLETLVEYGLLLTFVGVFQSGMDLTLIAGIASLLLAVAVFRRTRRRASLQHNKK